MENFYRQSNNLNDYPVFSNIDKTMVDRLATNLVKLLGNLSSVLHIDLTEIIYSKNMLMEIFERVEKRRIYFHIFYKGCKMGKLNEGALLCFWIVKLQPFYHPKIDTIKLNAKIAVCLFTNSIYFYLKHFNQKKSIPPHFVNDLYYSLLYRDISKEALMILAESFVDVKSH